MRKRGYLYLGYQQLRILTLSFLLLPVLLFFLYFVKRIISIPIAMLMLLACYRLVRDARRDERGIAIPWSRLVVIFFLCLLWCYLGGQGGLFYQTSDWNERNAVFRDLITNHWPVYYPQTDTALVYYIGHWLPAALIGRGLFVVFGNLEWGWRVGNIALMLWTVAGVLLSMLLLMQVLSARGKAGQWIAVAIMVGFSGMDIVGCLYKHWSLADVFRILHLEWWISDMQFSANTTCLFWVFNQAIPIWVATLLFLNERNNRGYMLIFVCAFISSPLPCIGLSVFMAGRVLGEILAAVRRENLSVYIRRSFSASNVIPLCFAFPIIALYYLSNSALENTRGDSIFAFSLQWESFLFMGAACLFLFALLAILCRNGLKHLSTFGVSALALAMGLIVYRHPELTQDYFVFLLLEVGFYFIALLPDHLDDPLYYLAVLIFMAAPVIKIGIGADFCMRVTIPAEIILMTMCARVVIQWKEEWWQGKKMSAWRTVSYVMIVACLLVGSVTPAVEVYRGIYKTISNHELILPADDIYTLNKYHSSGNVYGNFVSESYDDSFFFRYLAS